MQELYLKLGDLRGDSQRCGYEGWFELLSFEYGPVIAASSRPAEGQPGPKCTEAHFSKRSDQATRALYLAAATAKTFPTARLAMAGPGRMTVSFEDVTLTGMQIDQLMGEPVGKTVDSVSFRFGKVKAKYDLNREP